MFRVLLYFLVLIALAFGLAWLVDRPGEIALNWQGYRIETSILVGLGIVLVLVAALVVIWNVLRFVLRIAAQCVRRQAGPPPRKGLCGPFARHHRRGHGGREARHQSRRRGAETSAATSLWHCC